MRGKSQTTDSETKLAYNWTKLRVQDCLDRHERTELIRFLNDRYSERFFNPIRCLKRAPGNQQGYGFAIMALCCLLIETIQAYRKGLPCTYEKDLKRLAAGAINQDAPGDYRLQEPFKDQIGKPFQDFFLSPAHMNYFPGVDGDIFFREIRCGLLHQAQTSGGWKIVCVGRFWDDSTAKSINRDEFSQRLEECFKGYLQELNEEQSWDGDIWKPARKKIWWLVQGR